MLKLDRRVPSKIALDLYVKATHRQALDAGSSNPSCEGASILRERMVAAGGGMAQPAMFGKSSIAQWFLLQLGALQAPHRNVAMRTATPISTMAQLKPVRLFAICLFRVC